MQSFKSFLNEARNTYPDQGALDANGLPCVHISHDRSLLKGVPGVDPSVPDVAGPGDKLAGPEAAEAAALASLKEGRGGDLDLSKSWEKRNDNDHIGPTHDHVAAVLDATQKREGKDHEHLFRYTDGSHQLNRALHQAHIKGEPAPSHVGDPLHKKSYHHVAALDDALHRNSLHDDVHFYSGVAFHPGKQAAKHADNHIHLPAYTSSSIDKDTAQHFAHAGGYRHPEIKGHDKDGTEIHGHIIHFHMKKGQKGAYVGAKSSYSTEREFLVPRNTTIKVHPRPERYQDAKTGKHYHVWHARVVDPK